MASLAFCAPREASSNSDEVRSSSRFVEFDLPDPVEQLAFGAMGAVDEADLVIQQPPVDRLDDKGRCAPGECAVDSHHILAAGDNDDRKALGGLVRAQGFEHAEAIEPRHFEIEQHHIGALRADMG